jgi:hypothetical protein
MFYPSVVRVEAAMSASGFVVGSAEQSVVILTAYHPLQGSTSIKIAFWENRNKWIPATLQAFEPDLDIALLVVALPETRRDRQIFVKEDLVANEIVTVVGHPSGLLWQCIEQPVTALETSNDQRLFLFFSALWEPGLSGAPVFDREAELVGLAVRRTPTGEQVSVKIGTILSRPGWQALMNLVQPRRTPNSLSSFRVVETNADGLVFTVNYVRDPTLRVKSNVLATPLDGSDHAPLYVYKQTDTRVTEPAGSVQISISGLGDGLRTSGFRVCMYPDDSRSALACKIFPFRRTWTAAIGSRIDSFSEIRDAQEKLCLKVAYTVEERSAPQPDGFSENVALTITATLIHAGNHGNPWMDLGNLKGRVEPGKHLAVMSFSGTTELSVGDVVRVCFDSAGYSGRYKGLEFGCLSQQVENESK